MRHPLADAVALQLGRATTTSAELQARLRISQPVVSRILTELQRAGRAIAFGNARATRYAAPREIAGLGTFPVTRIDAGGTPRAFGILRAVAPSAYLFTAADGANELFDGLPWFIADMRPQGFLGRAFPKLHPDLGLPSRVADWTDDQVVTALARRGQDCIGDLVVGDESLRRFIQEPAVAVPARGVSSWYEKFARGALAGTPAGSAAGGEQPKFAVTLRGPTANRHVLVKFTERSNRAVDRRMRDLMICECLALDALQDSALGFVVPRHRLVQGERHQFLEVERFDRTGDGRLGIASLLAIDSHFIGRMTTWSETAVRLLDRKLVSDDDARRMTDLETFGRLIGNTDMHDGNLSFFRPDGPASPPFRLAPVYDQLPMLYAPVAGEIVERRLRDSIIAPSALGLPNFGRVVEAATEFWRRVSAHALVSTGFRAIAAANATQVRALARPG